MKTYRARFVMIFEGDIKADTDEEADAALRAIGPEAVWESGDWLLEDTSRKIVDSWDNEP